MPNMLFKFRLNPGAISLHDDEERKKLLTVLLLTSGMAAGILFLVQDIFAGNLVEVGVDLGLIFLFSAFATLLVKPITALCSAVCPWEVWPLP